jgi:hypothetical protein
MSDRTAALAARFMSLTPNRSHLMKALFLADWKAATRLGRPLLSGGWRKAYHDLPWSEKAAEVLSAFPPDKSAETEWTQEEEDVIAWTRTLILEKGWSFLTMAVMQSFPMARTEIFESLDLEGLAALRKVEGKGFECIFTGTD